MVIVDPRGRGAGSRSDYFASTHDLARTILAMAGVPPPPPMGGVDLSQLFRGRAPEERTFTYGGWSNNHFLRDARWGYMADNGLSQPRLFDLRADPGETRNVAAEHPDVVAELGRRVDERTGGSLPVYRS
jgi:arylsulfatase A-like enzyme